MLPWLLPVQLVVSHVSVAAGKHALVRHALHTTLSFRRSLKMKAAVGLGIAAVAIWLQCRGYRVTNALRRLSLARKQWLGFCALILLSIASSLAVYERAQHVSEVQKNNMVSDEVEDWLDQIHLEEGLSRGSIRKYTLTGLDIDRQVTVRAVAARKAASLKARRFVQRKASPLLVPLNRYIAASTDYDDKVTGHYLDLISQGRAQTVVEALQTGYEDPYRNAVDQSYSDLKARSDRWAKDWDQQIDGAISDTVIIVIVAGLFSVAIGFGLAILFARGISRPIIALTDSMNRLAAGDENVTIPTYGWGDEIGDMANAVEVFKDAAIRRQRLEEEALRAAKDIDDQKSLSTCMLAAKAQEQSDIVALLAEGLSRLADGDLVQKLDGKASNAYEAIRQDFNAALTRLHATMIDVAKGATRIADGTLHMSRTSDQLKERAAEQARNLEQTAAGLDAIMDTVGLTAAGTAQAHSKCSDARKMAEQSSDVANQAISAMGIIEAASLKIASFTQSISAIAAQTNLLALNASVEAARAGASGRGFAVVAEEVKLLAKQSATASQEIQSLTQMSAEQVQNGVHLVGKVGHSLHGIVDQIVEMEDIVNGIAVSAEQQSVALAHINVSLAAIDGVTRKNSVMAHDATDLAHHLSEDALDLRKSISLFRL